MSTDALESMKPRNIKDRSTKSNDSYIEKASHMVDKGIDMFKGGFKVIKSSGKDFGLFQANPNNKSKGR